MFWHRTRRGSTACVANSGQQPHCGRLGWVSPRMAAATPTKVSAAAEIPATASSNAARRTHTRRRTRHACGCPACASTWETSDCTWPPSRGPAATAISASTIESIGARGSGIAAITPAIPIAVSIPIAVGTWPKVVAEPVVTHPIIRGAIVGGPIVVATNLDAGHPGSREPHIARWSIIPMRGHPDVVGRGVWRRRRCFLRGFDRSCCRRGRLL